jgi:2-oxoglutarate ferredoxin oxidoreductase subunit gamma
VRYEVRLGGTGGQGIILAGILLAEAGVAENHYAVHAQNYGPEARGGKSISEVIFSDRAIDYPRTLELDLLLALNQSACDDNLAAMKKTGLVVVDSDYVKRPSWGRVLRAQIVRRARDRFGSERVCNMIALGLVVPFCPYVSPRSMARVLRTRMSGSNLESNLRAFKDGLKVARRLAKELTVEEIEGAVEV